jgi:DNA-binding CsgD family transcriptional regulator
VLLLPLQPINLIDDGLLGAIAERVFGSVGRDQNEFARAEEWYSRTFACERCHRVSRFSRANHNAWNELISYLTGGLLYGREVAKPRDFYARKRPFRPRLRAAPRREQVLRRVLNGWTIRQICRDLGITRDCLGHHIRSICRQEHVKNRHELARKLNSAHPQPLTQREGAAERRERMLPLLLRGYSCRQIMTALSIDLSTAWRTIYAIYREHGLQGSGSECQRLLAEKLKCALPVGRARRRGEGRNQIKQGPGELRPITFGVIGTLLATRPNLPSPAPSLTRLDLPT